MGFVNHRVFQRKRLKPIGFKFLSWVYKGGFEMGIPEKAKFCLQLLGCGLLEGSLQTGHWGLNIATFHVGRPLVTYKYATSKTLGCNGFLRVIEGSLERRGRVWEGRINIGYTFLVAGCSPK